jgi:hypothetical protein
VVGLVGVAAEVDGDGVVVVAVGVDAVVGARVEVVDWITDAIGIGLTAIPTA